MFTVLSRLIVNVDHATVWPDAKLRFAIVHTFCDVFGYLESWKDFFTAQVDKTEAIKRYSQRLVAPNMSLKQLTARIWRKSKHMISPFSASDHTRLPSFEKWQSTHEFVPLCTVSTWSLFFSIIEKKVNDQFSTANFRHTYSTQYLYRHEVWERRDRAIRHLYGTGRLFAGLFYSQKCDCV